MVHRSTRCNSVKYWQPPIHSAFNRRFSSQWSFNRASHSVSWSGQLMCACAKATAQYASDKSLHSVSHYKVRHCRCRSKALKTLIVFKTNKRTRICIFTQQKHMNNTCVLDCVKYSIEYTHIYNEAEFNCWLLTLAKHNL